MLYFLIKQKHYVGTENETNGTNLQLLKGSERPTWYGGWWGKMVFPRNTIMRHSKGYSLLYGHIFLRIGFSECLRDDKQGKTIFIQQPPACFRLPARTFYRISDSALFSARTNTLIRYWKWSKLNKSSVIWRRNKNHLIWRLMKKSRFNLTIFVRNPHSAR